MKISVVLCSFNGEKYISEQLKSIVGQTRKPDEFIVCDDCSTDNTPRILQTFQKEAPFPVKIIHNEFNLGSTLNFEKAILLCEGDIIALSDQDDVWKPDKLEKIVSAFKSHTDAGYVFTDAELVDKNLKPLGRRLWKTIRFHRGIKRQFENGEQFLCLLRQHLVTGATMAFRSSLRELILPFPTDTIWIHDAWIALVASALGRYGIPLFEPLILYRQHSSQQMGVPEISMLEGIKDVKMRLINILNEGQESYFYLREHLAAANHQHGIDTGKELEQIDDIILHNKNRLAISSSSGIVKIKLICDELISGRYARYANSWLSAIRDLIIS